MADGPQPGPDGFQLGLFVPGPPTHDAATALALQQLVAKGAMPPLVLAVDDCRARYTQWLAQGVEFTRSRSSAMAPSTPDSVTRQAMAGR